MQLDAKDFVVARVGNRDMLGRVLELTDDNNVVIKFYKPDDTTFEDTRALDEVLANLGRKPPIGRVYGANVAPRLTRVAHDFFGDISFYVRLDETKRNKLIEHLDLVERKLAQHKLPQLEMQTHIRQRKGKMAGSYKPGSPLDTMTLMPDGAENKQEILHLVGHEYGHGLWCHHMSPKLKLRWFALFREQTTVEVLDGKAMDEIRDILESNGSVKNAIGQSTEETAAIIRVALKHIKDVHGLTSYHINTMLSADESLADIWPPMVELGSRAVFVTDYARKAPEELWCESFGYWLAGNKVPKKAQSLVELTIAKI